MKKYSLVNEKEYAEYLIGQLYKILPLYEEHSEHGYKHIDSIILEIEGMEDLFIECDSRIEYFRLLTTLNPLYDILLLPSLSENNIEEHDLVKREVFKCTSMVKSLAGLDGDKH